MRRTDGTYAWKLNVSGLLNNIGRITEGIGFEKYDIVEGFPVIFIKGGNSDYLPEEDFQGIKRVFPAAELIVLPGAGHWIHSDKPSEVIGNIRRLLPGN
jgi:pimeloyl-ACP methyl ester carboxylesterase